MGLIAPEGFAEGAAMGRRRCKDQWRRDGLEHDGNTGQTRAEKGESLLSLRFSRTKVIAPGKNASAKCPPPLTRAHEILQRLHQKNGQLMD